MKGLLNDYTGWNTVAGLNIISLLNTTPATAKYSDETINKIMWKTQKIRVETGSRLEFVNFVANSYSHNVNTPVSNVVIIGVTSQGSSEATTPGFCVGLNDDLTSSVFHSHFSSAWFYATFFTGSQNIVGAGTFFLWARDY